MGHAKPRIIWTDHVVENASKRSVDKKEEGHTQIERAQKTSDQQKQMILPIRQPKLPDGSGKGGAGFVKHSTMKP